MLSKVKQYPGSSLEHRWVFKNVIHRQINVLSLLEHQKHENTSCAISITARASVPSKYAIKHGLFKQWIKGMCQKQGKKSPVLTPPSTFTAPDTANTSSPSHALSHSPLLPFSHLSLPNPRGDGDPDNIETLINLSSRREYLHLLPWKCCQRGCYGPPRFPTASPWCKSSLWTKCLQLWITLTKAYIFVYLVPESCFIEGRESLISSCSQYGRVCMRVCMCVCVCVCMCVC